MKKKYVIVVLAIFFTVFHWEFSSYRWSNSWVAYSPYSDDIPKEQAKILLHEPEIRIPWTRFLPIYQFGKARVHQKSEYVFGDDEGPYTSATLIDESHRLGLFPKFGLETKLRESFLEYHSAVINEKRTPTDYKFETIEQLK